MAIITNKNVKVGMIIWSAYDDRPFDGYGWSKGKITAIFDDHYLFDDLDNNIENVWGLFDEEPCSVCNFTTEEECLDWLGLGK